MQVAEFMPEVAFVQCFAVGEREMLAACQCFEHGEMGCFWLVQTGEHGAGGTHTTLRGNHKACPALAGVRDAVTICYRFERTYHRCADGDDALPGAVRSIDHTGCLAGDTV